jgi:ElaB/YqjD/DUF883 family membrane-anchored ribosome-binding protein
MKGSNGGTKTLIENGLATVAEQASHYVDVGADALTAVSGQARKIRRTTEGYVRGNPWLAIGAAVGIGAVIGFLLRGRRRS